MVGVRRSLSSDEDGAVFAACRLDLLRYATALVGSSEAEDVVMTVVGRTVRRLRLAELDNPKGYLLRGVLNGLVAGDVDAGRCPWTVTWLEMIARVWLRFSMC